MMNRIRPRLFPVLPALCGAILLLTSGCGLPGEPRIVGAGASVVVPAEEAAARAAAADRALGARIFAERCTACHGEQGRGDGPSVLSGAIPSIVDLTDPATLGVSIPLDYFQIISLGRLERYMPPWNGLLSEDDRWAVAMYAYGLRAAPPASNE
jgi:mono/diheme cytochrome c family protein